MKNLFFALAFMLVGTFAFANTNDLTNSDSDITIKESFIQPLDSSISYNTDDSFGTCRITVTFTYYWPDGSITQRTETKEFWASSASHCAELAERWRLVF